MHALKGLIQRLHTTGNQSGKPGVIGLDFALQAVHFVQLIAKDAKSIRLHARSSMPYPMEQDRLLASPRDLKALIRTALRQSDFVGRKVVTSLPNRMTRILPVTYQHHAGQDAAQSIVKVLKDRVQDDLAEYVIDYLPVRNTTHDEQHLAIVALARREEVLSFLESLRHAGLEVQALEIGPMAIKRLVSAMASIDDFSNVLVVNVGTQYSYLTIISGRRLLFDQQINFGQTPVLASLSQSLEMEAEQVSQLIEQHGLTMSEVKQTVNGITDIDVTSTLREIIKPQIRQLTDEINRVLIYAAAETRGQPVKQIYLVGSMAHWRGSDELIQELLGIDVTTIPNPLNVLDAGESCGHEPHCPEIILATGLALRGMVDE